ncbi:MAG: hypothetical protein PHD01_15455, partial [Geobacteraceae bacterium]|nr:hypothetical protein [Geobacteraceae bacterium]
EEVLTRVEIIDSLGTGWCDVLNRGDETMIGYVRCEGLKILRPDMPENWHVIPSPKEGKPQDTETKKSPASPAGSDSNARSTGQPVKTRAPESAPQ